MNKRKTVFTAVVIGAGIMAVIDRVRLHNKVENLEEKAKDISRCHNEFCLFQERLNAGTEKDILEIKEEICSVYEHIEALSKEKEDGR